MHSRTTKRSGFIWGLLLIIPGLFVVDPSFGQAEQQGGCDPHYRGDTCVPIAYDVDCWPGQGNGPAYVSGPFQYSGEDIYELDRNKDGVACEPRPRK